MAIRLKHIQTYKGIEEYKVWHLYWLKDITYKEDRDGNTIITTTPYCRLYNVKCCRCCYHHQYDSSKNQNLLAMGNLINVPDEIMRKSFLYNYIDSLKSVDGLVYDY